jgi:ribonuclease T
MPSLPMNPVLPAELAETLLSSQSFFKNRFRGYLPVVIDVETGGFEAGTHALLEIAAITLKEEEGQLKIDQSYFFAIKPFIGSIITDAALEFNGIVPDSALRGAVDEITALTDLFKHIRAALKQYHCHRAILVGHNAGFDHEFLRAAVARNEIKRDPFHPFSHLDTVSLGMLAYGHSVLTRACKLGKIDFDDKEAHSALYDATKTAELFCQIFNQWHNYGGWPIKQ